MCVRSAQGVRGVRVTRHGNSEKRGRRSNCQTRGNSAGLPAALAPRASRCSLSLEARAVERQSGGADLPDPQESERIPGTG